MLRLFLLPKCDFAEVECLAQPTDDKPIASFIYYVNLVEENGGSKGKSAKDEAQSGTELVP